MAGFLCSLPHWVAMWRNAGDYTPFSVSPSVSSVVFDETHAYAPPARHFADTGRIAAEVDNFEHRERKAAVPVLPTTVLGSTARVLGTLERAFIFADCLFPACLFLLFYWLAGTAVTTPAIRLLIAWSSLLVSFNFANTLWLGDDALTAPLEVTRTPQPELSFVVLLAATALFALALRERAYWPWIAAAGILSGAVVYSYYFYAVAWGAALASAVVFGVLWQRRFLWTRALAVLFIMVALSVPYAVAAVHSNSPGGQSDLLGRVGVFTHKPSLVALIAAAILAVLVWRYARRLTTPLFLVLALIVLGAVCGMNVQLLSGYETQPWHFWKRLGLPAAFFLGAMIVGRWAEHDVAHASRVASLLIALLIANTAVRLCVAGVRTAPDQRASNPDIELLRWADRHLPRSVVLGTIEPELILLIPTLTSDFTYVPSGLRSLTSTSEIVNRYYQVACLLGLSPAQVESAAARPSHLGHSTEVLHTLALSYSGDTAIFHQFVGEYRSVYARCPRIAYRLDFAVVSSAREKQAVQRRFPFARELYRNSRYALLALGASRPNERSY